jgi:hypothetical protein
MSLVNKNLVFSVTHGRTATTMLTEVFKLFKDTCSEHEPEPNYASIFPQVKDNPKHAIAFLEKKLNHIAKKKEPNYVETSNVFGKGYLIPLLRLGVFPGLVFLNRDFRKVALSLYQRGSTPMKTPTGQHYSADPTFPGGLAIYYPETLSDYQLCFWGVLDSYYRQRQAEQIYKHEGLETFFWVTAEGLNDYETALEMGRRFSLEPKASAQQEHAKITAIHHNPNVKKRGAEDIDFMSEELEVIDRVSFYEPIFIENLLGSEFLEQALVSRVRQ